MNSGLIFPSHEKAHKHINILAYLLYKEKMFKINNKIG
jgi:hypothetical protein